MGAAHVELSGDFGHAEYPMWDPNRNEFPGCFMSLPRTMRILVRYYGGNFRDEIETDGNFRDEIEKGIATWEVKLTAIESSKMRFRTMVPSEMRLRGVANSSIGLKIILDSRMRSRRVAKDKDGEDRETEQAKNSTRSLV